MGISFDFSRRTVIVTGAAQGIGKALTDLFAQSGARIVPVDANGARLTAAWGDATDAVCPLVCDVTQTAGVEVLVSQVIDWSGSVDVLVNNAGITRDAVVWKMDDQQWHDVIAVHLTGTFNLTRAAVPHMRAAAYGRIVNVTSYTGLHGNVGQANYAAAKAGIIGFTKTVAKEVARFGITVNAISPNADTAMTAAIPAEKRAELTASIPIGRFGEADEMSAAVGFLASEEAGYITGVVLPVDGGLSM